MNERQKSYSVLVTDVDNTLFDWFEVWHRSFKSMIDEISRISGIHPDELFPEIRKVHQKHGTSEYSFLINEIPSLQKAFEGKNLLEVFEPAISKYRQARREALKLYPSVGETLKTLKERGVLIVAYTESQAFYTNYRFRKLNLDGLVDYLYSPPDHEIPEGESRLSIRSKPIQSYEFQKTIHQFTPKGELKPNPNLLRDIIKSVGATIDQVIYVGDSRVKDIAMAQDAGVTDVFAEYGTSHNKEEYQLLVNVTHWTDEDVERERQIGEREVSPNYTLKSSFSELLQMFEFSPFREKVDV